MLPFFFHLKTALSFSPHKYIWMIDFKYLYKVGTLGVYFNPLTIS